MDATEAANELISQIRDRPWGLAVVALSGEQIEYRIDTGRDQIQRNSLFQIGSITKTMTGVLLATAVIRGEVALDTPLSEVLGVTGAARDINLLELATQRSGLPRLPPNLDLATIDQSDPYATYAEDDLRHALDNVELGDKTFEYSNFGFMALALAVATTAAAPFDALLEERLFKPSGMTAAGCPPTDQGRVVGYAGATPTPWWTTRLPGSGGVGASIEDLASYLRAHLYPPTGELGEAITLATTIHAPGPSPMGLGWGHQGGGWFHDGGTGGFSSFAAFHRPTATAVGLLANGGNLMGLDRAGMSVLTAMVKGTV